MSDVEKALRPDEDAEPKKEGQDQPDEKEKKEDAVEKCATEKSEDLTQDDLEKSIEQLEEAVNESSEVDRKSTLLSKAMEEELDKSEQEELSRLLGGGSVESPAPLAEEVVKSMDSNEEMNKALDVSEYLQEQHTELNKSLAMLGEHIEKSDLRQQSFNILLAKAVSEVGKLAKSMDSRLEVIEGQPVRAPKSQVKGTPTLEKSFAGKKPEEGQLNKAMVLDTLSGMIKKSVDAGRGGATETGIDMVTAASKFEQNGQISPQLLEMVKQERSAIQ